MILFVDLLLSWDLGLFLVAEGSERSGKYFVLLSIEGYLRIGCILDLELEEARDLKEFFLLTLVFEDFLKEVADWRAAYSYSLCGRLTPRAKT